VVSTRAGWTGNTGLPTELWLGATYWDTFATATGTVSDPDGGSLRFEVDQGPRWPWTYSVGSHVVFNPHLEAAVDIGTDFHGGWSLALIPVFRFSASLGTRFPGANIPRRIVTSSREENMRPRWTLAILLALAFAAAALAQSPPRAPTPAAASPATPAPTTAPPVPASAATPAAPAAPTSPVGGIRNKISAADLPSAESILEVYRVKFGEDSNWLTGLSWLARGALLTGDTAKAKGYADDVQAQIDKRLAAGADLEKDHLETPAGAAIEVEAQILAGRRSPKAAADYVRAQLPHMKGPPSFQSRLNKRINLLELEGTPAPELVVDDFLGPKPPALASLKGKPVLLFGWAEWCGDCRAQAASLAAARSRFAGQGLRVIALTRYYEDPESLSARVRERARVDSVWRADYADLKDVPVVFSTASMIRYGVSSTPTFVFVDRAGIVRRYTPTRLTGEEFDRSLGTLAQ